MEARAGDGVNDSPLTAEHTIKRLDFEHIPVVSSTRTISSMRAQAMQIRRGLENCREDVPDPQEFIESLKTVVAENANVDTSKLWEKYLIMKKEFLEVEAENLFLESYLKPEGEPDPKIVTESELHALEGELVNIHSMSKKETEEIDSLIGEFTAEMEAYPRLLDSALVCFDEYDKRVQSTETPALVEHMDGATETDVDLERKACEIALLTGNVETEILETDAKILKQEECYKRLQNLHETHTKLELLHKILSFFSDWSVIDYANNVVVLAFKGSAQKHKKAVQNKHTKPVKDVEHRLHVRVHPKTLAVESAQLEPKNESSLEDILKEMAFRRAMQSVEVTAEPHNDLEFLLRRVGQRVMSLRRSGA